MPPFRNPALSLTHLYRVFLFRLFSCLPHLFSFSDRGAEQLARRQPDGGRLRPVVLCFENGWLFLEASSWVRGCLVFVFQGRADERGRNTDHVVSTCS